jgi:glycosyltransferase involved in cell wall biosynthesis
MKVLNIMCCYNELEYIPKVIKYYIDAGIDIYVLDNKSTDGSWEWLNDNNIRCEQFDTDGCFNLEAQQQTRKNIALENPRYDWIIYGDADEYIVCKPELQEIFKGAMEYDCNIIRMKSFDVYNTGEERLDDITKTYFYYKERYTNFNGIERIYRNVANVTYSGDFIMLPNKKYCDIGSGNVLNYGGTKTFEQREDVYLRRKKAWDTGVTQRAHGAHYEVNHNKGWRWDRSELKDMREHPDFKFIKPNVIDLLK